MGLLGYMFEPKILMISVIAVFHLSMLVMMEKFYRVMHAIPGRDTRKNSQRKEIFLMQISGSAMLLAALGFYLMVPGVDLTSAAFGAGLYCFQFTLRQSNSHR